MVAVLIMVYVTNKKYNMTEFHIQSTLENLTWHDILNQYDSAR